MNIFGIIVAALQLLAAIEAACRPQPQWQQVVIYGAFATASLAIAWK